MTEGRVNGSLNLSRALGDMEYKRRKFLFPSEQMVTACPDVRTLDLKRGDDFCILACDGIWDVLTEQQVCYDLFELWSRAVAVLVLKEDSGCCFGLRFVKGLSLLLVSLGVCIFASC